MCRLTYFGILSLALSMLLGCAMCCGPYDDHYHLYGGKFQRVDPINGRVGSILSDPAYRGGGPSADSNLAPETPLRAPEPIDPDDDRDIDIGDDDQQTEEEIRREMERLRKELQLDRDVDELPGPTPQPDLGDDRETSRGWQNRLRGRNRQWR